MYASHQQHSQHQRSSSNPRQYSSTDLTPVAGDARRDDPTQVYQEGYTGYSQSGSYPGMTNVNYQYNQGIGLPSYSTASPVNPSRRTSAGKPAGTPPASAPPAGANPSPGSRYYPATQGTPDPNQAMSAPSPYQPSSAPPQVGSHQQSQPQTAHPYGGGYYNYYDHQHQQGQWPSHYGQQGSFPQPSARQAQSASTTPQTAVPETQHRTQQPASASYDYSQYQGYNAHDRTASTTHQQQQWPTPTSASSRYSISSQGTGAQPWQGYPSHHGVPQPVTSHHINQGGVMSGQYAGWQQQQQWSAQGYGYPPATPHTATNPAAGVPPAHLAIKKDSKDYDGLGKRAAESGTEDEEEKDGKKKKGKKEEVEKPVPKPPAKSHLHPPRQAQSMWQLFFTDELNKAKAAAASGNSPGGTPHHAKLNVAQIAKDAGIAYANLTPEQKAYYVGKVQESKDQYAKDLAAWQATLTPEDIRVENAFRAQQRKEGKSRKGNLKDPNAPKKPLSAYFLFLKGIREDDALRARVWGDETETTKQSVLAAERWRSLTDEEKKVFTRTLYLDANDQPFLSQAEKDKQEYEAARKIYEEDAAARARGEDVPTRTYPEPAVEVPKPVIKDVKPGDPIPPNETPLLTTTPKTDAVKDEDSSMFPSFLSEHAPSSDPVGISGSAGGQEASTGIDFGFSDPLDMEFGGFPNVNTGRTNGESGDWGNLTNLMGEETKPAAGANGNVSVAPGLDEAVAETGADGTEEQTLPKSESEVQEVARAAEGQLAVPQELEQTHSVPVEAEASANASGVPTEEVNELPKTDLPHVVDEINAPSGEPAQVSAVDAEASDPAGNPDPQSAPEAPGARQNGQDISIFADSASEAAEASPKGASPAIDAPVAANVPEGTTVEPATDASAETEDTPAIETEAPAADGV
ncbi:hypothetical protein DB88DRAFT_475231 [Papiliotrema laurentii]|uniref:HMG box domain-containing protein n=1 Tax=Papiliotrema laurentii TaxID=5418 RepID=A0AAD9FJ99_PAPLA|nr:hypothetical protein DB88DRAFT_475231 [Papiliotrema laurentii]